MGKLSRLRLKQQSNDRKSQEGVLEAELAMLSGTLPRNENNGRPPADREDIPPRPISFLQKTEIRQIKTRDFLSFF
jgi:hypothetical protein